MMSLSGYKLYVKVIRRQQKLPQDGSRSDLNCEWCVTKKNTSKPKHMLWVLKNHLNEAVFFEHSKHYMLRMMVRKCLQLYTEKLCGPCLHL